MSIIEAIMGKKIPENLEQLFIEEYQDQKATWKEEVENLTLSAGRYLEERNALQKQIEEQDKRSLSEYGFVDLKKPTTLCFVKVASSYRIKDKDGEWGRLTADQLAEKISLPDEELLKEAQLQVADYSTKGIEVEERIFTRTLMMKTERGTKEFAYDEQYKDEQLFPLDKKFSTEHWVNLTKEDALIEGLYYLRENMMEAVRDMRKREEEERAEVKAES